MKELIHGLIRLCFANIAIFLGISGQSIVIFPYNQAESYSSCTVGVLANSDVITIKGEAFFPENYSLFMLPFITVYKNIATPVGNSELCLLDITNSQPDNNCSVKASATKNVYSILISLTAAEELSEGKIIGSLLFKNSTKVQHEIMLPKIHRIDPATVATMIVNGENVKPQCNVTVSSRNLKIEATCQTFFKPCHLHLTYNDTELVKDGFDSVSFEKRLQNSADFSVVLTSTVCNKEIFQKIFYCKISLDFYADNLETTSASSPVLIGIVCGIILLAVVLCIIIIWVLFKKGVLKGFADTCATIAASPDTQDAFEANNKDVANDIPLPEISNKAHISVGIANDIPATEVSNNSHILDVASDIPLTEVENNSQILVDDKSDSEYMQRKPLLDAAEDESIMV